MRFSNFCTVKGRVSTTSACTFSLILSEATSTMGTPSSSARKFWQMRLPLVRRETASTTTRSGSEFSRELKAALPLATVST